MTLEAAGVSDAEESAYRVLVTMGRASAHDFAVRSGLGITDSEQILTALTAKGLASHTDGIPRIYRATPPDVALMPRLKQQADALDHARATATGLLEIYRDTMRRSDADQLIEVITGADALRQHLRRIQADTRDEMLWFCKAQYVAMPSGSNSDEFDALARGVRYRVLYEKAFFDDDGAVDNVIEGVRAGEVARAVPHLPLRLAVSDRAIAICPLVPGGPYGSPEEPTTALVRDSSLLAALVALFERYWDDAVPLHVDDSGTVSGTDGVVGADPLSATDRRLLSLLVAGVADKAIASQMGLSRRTVQRHIQQLMTFADAATRMQLAWQAARRGWV
ncbi:helix-turn-helix domain-containing protein [Streptomyces sp. NPDC002917]|uniref:helix-turn-helix domain-containing protein n=1 Tax=unclassified Streptomyces TaxID=2593676 RepID=UPI002E810280|nr:helix-turn-helix domain-containing protein [Streptomyces sp. NBC_00562]WTC78680.1 LuxR C-terminal-related transcriptional regulator [Streptomyces sp. NBC_01653]WTD36791.1 LuxR C-terminal-related transcriptional regulator [Streptomyces sp. NBC_01643]WTD92182.1 LuxR C-terminal-related transcriptional regulator [Streptomyces sp. NBC_01637]WUC23259.1 LuxR C-terminal-related transcriptional regulator [Streptomyces sp. NBC_00562]